MAEGARLVALPTTHARRWGRTLPSSLELDRVKISDLVVLAGESVSESEEASVQNVGRKIIKNSIEKFGDVGHST